MIDRFSRDEVVVWGRYVFLTCRFTLSCLFKIPTVDEQSECRPKGMALKILIFLFNRAYLHHYSFPLVSPDHGISEPVSLCFPHLPDPLRSAPSTPSTSTISPCQPKEPLYQV